MSVLSALPTMNFGLLQSSCTTGEKQSKDRLVYLKKKRQLRGDTGAFGRCVHIPGLLISLKSQSLEHKKTHTHQMQAAEAFTLKERPR